MISLGPPRKPAGTRAERNWHLVIPRPGGRYDHVSLYGTRCDDPQGAQTAANEHLGHDYTWVPKGTGFHP